MIDFLSIFKTDYFLIKLKLNIKKLKSKNTKKAGLTLKSNPAFMKLSLKREIMKEDCLFFLKGEI